MLMFSAILILGASICLMCSNTMMAGVFVAAAVTVWAIGELLK